MNSALEFIKTRLPRLNEANGITSDHTNDIHSFQLGIVTVDVVFDEDTKGVKGWGFITYKNNLPSAAIHSHETASKSKKPLWIDQMNKWLKDNT